MIVLGRWAFLLQCLLSSAAVMLRQGPGGGGPDAESDDGKPKPIAIIDGIRIDEIITPSAALNKMWNKLFRVQTQDDYLIMNFSKKGLCFPPPLQDVVKEHWGEIGGNVERGWSWAAERKVIFAGLIRDAKDAVFPAYVALKSIAHGFMDYHVFLLENDSNDGTPRWLKTLGKVDNKFEFQSEKLTLENSRGVQQARFQRMANLRNRLRDWIEDWIGAQKDSSWNLIVMLDFDIFKSGPFTISRHSFFASLGRHETIRDEWDMMCANGLYRRDEKEEKYGMFDCFAFRTKFDDSFNAGTCGRDNTTGLKLWAGYNLVPVHSCFGGMTLYRPKAFFRCHYDPSVYDCEHVVLHQCMRKSGSEGRMFMDQLLTTNYDSLVHQKCMGNNTN